MAYPFEEYFCSFSTERPFSSGGQFFESDCFAYFALFLVISLRTLCYNLVFAFPQLKDFFC